MSIKTRRHSLSSLESAKMEGMDSKARAVAGEGARKRPLEGPEGLRQSVAAKRPMLSIADVVGGLQGNKEGNPKEELQLTEDTLCCLPGGKTLGVGLKVCG